MKTCKEHKQFDPFLAYGPIKENEELKTKIEQLQEEIIVLNSALDDFFEWFDEYEPNVGLAHELRKKLEE